MLGALKQLEKTHAGPTVDLHWAFSGAVMVGACSTGIAVVVLNLRASARNAAAEAVLSHFV